MIPRLAFVGAEKLLRRAKVINSKITLKQVKEFRSQNPINQVFQKPKNAKLTPKINGKLGHYQADLTFLTRYDTISEAKLQLSYLTGSD